MKDDLIKSLNNFKQLFEVIIDNELIIEDEEKEQYLWTCQKLDELGANPNLKYYWKVLNETDELPFDSKITFLNTPEDSVNFKL